MLRSLLSVSSLLVACSPSPQKAAMPNPSPAAERAASNPLADSPAEAAGRHILSTAFVRVGPDRQLTVELHDGRVLVLRDVVMRPKDYCGLHTAGAAKFCGGYANVAAARPGGAPAPDQPDVAASSPAQPARIPGNK